MKIYLGADHRGYLLKEKIAIWLFEMEHAYMDLGAEKLDPHDDYTKYAEEVASLVAKNEGSRGVLLCGSGVGVDVVANKFDGIRASIGKSVLQVEAGRRDDDMNVLVIAADYTTEKETKAMLIAFLETKFSGKARYEERLEEIERIEANN
ncbi:MAG: Ribose-5-phosphate isomerase B [Candidatus Woesebacteria bacterium GW2011_GWA2_40_7]|uniref:Ribose-5-phosphate isomerase B n=3 Tax=Candidatus Woeseibacteriota TaxID=1752722 RepID=A0A0G0X6D9_9BACT|nr:MAG: Ribose-5-phosphate isomerase B [Candidatus Woesebacteria bacterium GW2011_GWB1_39_10]KKR72743.1 MAG: Ribose-5-phosphate isomerase B [Candidatus Woesebacteria bacterium GW2011_GWA2_40_7]KKR92215.1 MAG: Ribose-5-phosphate isomerase B [Candidatus Woesebacteria bacterium GW2011_GWA1_41_13b]